MQPSSCLVLIFITLSSLNALATRPTQLTQITGSDELHKVDVVLEGGFRKMLTKASTVPESLGNLVFINASNGGNINIAQNCNTDQIFVINAEGALGADLVIEELRFSSLCAGIKIDKGLCGNQPWADGILVRITSNGVVFSFLPIKQTSQFDSHFSYGSGSRFSLVFASGADFMTSSFSPKNPFVLKKGTTDKIEVLCRDNLTQASFIDFIAFGFRDA